MALGQLQPWERNPRKLTKAQAERLADSLETFGQVETIAIGPGNEVYNGHQRLSVLLKVHGGGYEIEARRASRELSEAERRKLTAYLHAGAVGDWDWDALAAWDVGELVTWGFDTELLRDWNDNAANLAAMLEAETAEEEIPEETSILKPFRMARVLVSFPIDCAVEVKEILDSLGSVGGIEIIYGSN